MFSKADQYIFLPSSYSKRLSCSTHPRSTPLWERARAAKFVSATHPPLFKAWGLEMQNMWFWHKIGPHCGRVPMALPKVMILFSKKIINSRSWEFGVIQTSILLGQLFPISGSCLNKIKKHPRSQFVRPIRSLQFILWPKKIPKPHRSPDLC